MDVEYGLIGGDLEPPTKLPRFKRATAMINAAATPTIWITQSCDPNDICLKKGKPSGSTELARF